MKTGWVWAVAALAALWLLPPHPALAGAPWGPVLRAAGLVLAVGGVVMRLWATLYIGGRKARYLVVTGPYSICRHPLYLATTAVLAGIALRSARPALLVLVIAYAVYYAVSVRAEESRLAAAFPDEWEEYRGRVPGFWPGGSVDPGEPRRVPLYALRREAVGAMLVAAALAVVEAFTPAGP